MNFGLKTYSFRALFTLLLVSIVLCSISQVNIPIPPANLDGFSGGSLAYDILHADNHVFIYSSQKIYVYNTINEKFKTIELSNYGKFNPIFYQPRFHVPSIQLMTVDDPVNPSYLYFMDPEAEIKRVSFSSIIGQGNPVVEDVFEIPETNNVSENFTPVNGVVVLKYHKRNGQANDRLYWLVKGCSVDYGPGNFHESDSYFAILNIDNGGSNSVSLQYEKYASDENNDSYEDINIADYVFNTENDYFYLAKLGKVERWEVDASGASIKGDVSIYQFISNLEGDENHFKFGKLLYINEANVHKIIALPYKYPSSAENHHIALVFDGDNTVFNNNVTSVINPPGDKITDALYIDADPSNDNSRKHLILCYNPQSGNTSQTTDICVYKCVDNNPSPSIYDYEFVEEDEFTYDTDNSLVTSVSYDINTPFSLTAESTTKVVVSKKDEICEINWSGTTYLIEQIKNNESSFFTKSASGNNSTFVLNSMLAGLEKISSDGVTTTKLGYPVYHIVANSDGSRMYCYNTLATYNSGLYIIGDGPTVNINDIQDDPSKCIEKAIGDVIYNPYNNTFLISENGDFGSTTSTKIKIYGDEDDGQGNIIKNQFIESISLPIGVQYARNMYIAPDKRLYVMANMHKSLNPKIIVYSAINYEKLYQIDLVSSSTDEFDYYSGYFCYNPFNNKMYATIHPTEITLDPYQSSRNTMFSFGNPFDNQNTLSIDNGIFIGFYDGNPDNILNYPIDFPAKIVCPDLGPGNNSQFQDHMILIGKELKIYDFVEKNFVYHNHTFSFNDITYSKYRDRLYGIVDLENTNGDDRKTVIKTIDLSEGQILIDDLAKDSEKATILGQCSGIFTNPYDSKIYIYNKMDNIKLGNSTRLYSFEPGYESNISFISLDNIVNLYPELDHCPDFHYYFYNLITPYFHPSSNYMYFPNGGHSNLSRIDYVPNEALLLNNGTYPNTGCSWISLPRMDRNGNDGVDVDIILNENIIPNNYQDDSFIETMPEEATSEIDNEYSFIDDEWQNTGGLSKIYSTNGYKLYLNYDPSNPPDNKWVMLKGSYLDPDETIKLFAGYENWTGYWIHQDQYLHDAISDYEDNIISVEHQNFFCTRVDPIRSGSPLKPEFPLICSQQGIIKYGDMVVFHMYDNVDEFAWNYQNNPPDRDVIDDLKHFEYVETNEYTGFVIELDSTDNPDEIGVMVNDSCMGACSVAPGDTVAMLRGYIGDTPGDSVVFEEYHGTKSSSNIVRKEYFVRDFSSGLDRIRTIRTDEGQKFYTVSFKNKSQDSIFEPKDKYRINVYPNPTSNQINIDYRISDFSHVKITIYNTYGQRIANIFEGIVESGKHSLKWERKTINGVHIFDGLYILQCEINGVSYTTKIVVQ